jgi:hypothetical protein
MAVTHLSPGDTHAQRLTNAINKNADELGVKITSSEVDNSVVLTAAAYIALSVKDTRTLYYTY